MGQQHENSLGSSGSECVCQGEFGLLCVTGIAERQELGPLTLAVVGNWPLSGSEENLHCPNRDGLLQLGLNED